MTILEISKKANETAKQKGFYDAPLNVAEKLMLIVSELGEAVEAHRKDRHCQKQHILDSKYLLERGNMEDWQEHFETHIKDCFEDELVDAAIRLFDLAYQMGVDLEWHTEAKMKYNERRPYKHGKLY